MTAHTEASGWAAPLEDALRGLLDGVPEPHLVIDQSGRIRFANRAATEHFGPPVEPTGHTSVAEVVDRLQLGAGERLLGALADRTPRTLPVDGRQSAARFTSVDVWPVAGGWAVRFNPRASDQVPGDQADEDRCSLFFESGPLPMWIFDPETLQILDVNKAAVTQYGYSRDEFLTLTLRDLREPEEVPSLLSNVQIPISPATSTRGVFRHRRKDGTDIDAEIFLQESVYRGKRVGITLALDVTEQKKLAEALATSQAELTAIIQGMGDVVLVVDREGRFHDVAPTAAPLSRRAARHIGNKLHDILPVETADPVVEAIRRALDNQTTEYAQYELQVEDESVWLSGSFAPMSDSLVVWVGRDITTLKRYEKVLAEAKREADNANRAKSEFLSRMSHELRTPLNSVLGYAQLLEFDLVDPVQCDNVQQILNAGMHLLDLINEVLDISRIESGNLSLLKEPVLLSEVVDASLALLKPMADENRVALPLSMEAEAQPYVLADRQRLKQVALNLLSNAIKYNRLGGAVSVRCIQRPNNRVRVTVSDMGSGIPREALDRLFIAFDRLGAESTTVEGTGLGLALSKALVEAMDGEMGVSSEEGRGSEFWFELRATLPQVDGAVDDPRCQAGAPAPRVHRRILCIEDDLSNVGLLRRIFARRPEIELILAEEGSLGVEMLQSRDIDIVLLDINRPGSRVDEVMERLKADPLTAHLPIVVLTADATVRDTERLRTSGAYHVVTKPFDIADLLSIVDAIEAGSAELP